MTENEKPRFSALGPTCVVPGPSASFQEEDLRWGEVGASFSKQQGPGVPVTASS